MEVETGNDNKNQEGIKDEPMTDAADEANNEGDAGSSAADQPATAAAPAPAPPTQQPIPLNAGTRSKQYDTNTRYKISQRLKEARTKVDAAYQNQELSRQEVQRIRDELQAAKSHLEIRIQQYKTEFESCRLVELEEPSPWVSFLSMLVPFCCLQHCTVYVSQPN